MLVAQSVKDGMLLIILIVYGVGEITRNDSHLRHSEGRRRFWLEWHHFGQDGTSTGVSNGGNQCRWPGSAPPWRPPLTPCQQVYWFWPSSCGSPPCRACHSESGLRAQTKPAWDRLSLWEHRHSDLSASRVLLCISAGERQKADPISFDKHTAQSRVDEHKEQPAVSLPSFLVDTFILR